MELVLNSKEKDKVWKSMFDFPPEEGPKCGLNDQMYESFIMECRKFEYAKAPQHFLMNFAHNDWCYEIAPADRVDAARQWQIKQTIAATEAFISNVKEALEKCSCKQQSQMHRNSIAREESLLRDLKAQLKQK